MLRLSSANVHLVANGVGTIIIDFPKAEGSPISPRTVFLEILALAERPHVAASRLPRHDATAQISLILGSSHRRCLSSWMLNLIRPCRARAQLRIVRPLA